jgi:hypothetical protein
MREIATITADFNLVLLCNYCFVPDNGSCPEKSRYRYPVLCYCRATEKLNTIRYEQIQMDMCPRLKVLVLLNYMTLFVTNKHRPSRSRPDLKSRGLRGLIAFYKTVFHCKSINVHYPYDGNGARCQT